MVQFVKMWVMEMGIWQVGPRHEMTVGKAGVPYAKSREHNLLTAGRTDRRSPGGYSGSDISKLVITKGGPLSLPVV
ncbi:hypothetical protein O3M35_005868 [Rhynocoris fuscipes]|uniref:Uncharacterized protein n=1 Tax=Rhynocoris fuscipes TaxID=488301 RepID=A0AAW1DK52_9HEMI